MNQRTILIAEDNPGLAKVLGFKFKTCGFEVVTATDGQAAWELYQESPVSAVVSDQEMPCKTGVELFRCIREFDKSVPLFLVTGRQLELSMTGVADELKLNGMFSKPFSPASVVAAVNVALDSTMNTSAGGPAASPIVIPTMTPAAPQESFTTV